MKIAKLKRFKISNLSYKTSRLEKQSMKKKSKSLEPYFERCWQRNTNNQNLVIKS